MKAYVEIQTKARLFIHWDTVGIEKVIFFNVKTISFYYCFLLVPVTVVCSLVGIETMKREITFWLING